MANGILSGCKIGICVQWETPSPDYQRRASPTFQCYEEQWQITTEFPRYHNQITVSVCNLTRQRSCKKATVFAIQLSFLRNNQALMTRETIESFDKTQWKYDFSLPLLNSNHNLLMRCQIFCTENQELGKTENAQQKECSNAKQYDVSEDLKAAVESVQHSDVILKLGDEIFPAHKIILSCRSKIFQAMFDHDCKESVENAVDLVDMDVATAKSMLQYIYTGNAGEFSRDNMIKLYSVADRYCLMGLLKQCREFMVRCMNCDNVCAIAAAADLHSDEDLIKAVKAFFHVNLKEIMKSKKRKVLSEHNPSLFIKLVEEAILQ